MTTTTTTRELAAAADDDDDAGDGGGTTRVRDGRRPVELSTVIRSQIPRKLQKITLKCVSKSSFRIPAGRHTLRVHSTVRLWRAGYQWLHRLSYSGIEGLLSLVSDMYSEYKYASRSKHRSRSPFRFPRRNPGQCSTID